LSFGVGFESMRSTLGLAWLAPLRVVFELLEPEECLLAGGKYKVRPAIGALQYLVIQFEVRQRIGHLHETPLFAAKLLVRAIRRCETYSRKIADYLVHQEFETSEYAKDAPRKSFAREFRGLRAV
jgi:hypothetical protein